MLLEGILLVTFLKIAFAQNDVFPMGRLIVSNVDEDSERDVMPTNNSPEVTTVTNEEDIEQDEHTKKPCAFVVLSSSQNSNMRSLLRKYRYDANGVLIPSSIKYFIKLPQGLGHRTSAILVPLNDKAFSPSGGFVRYYKEVPPIPYSWY